MKKKRKREKHNENVNKAVENLFNSSFFTFLQYFLDRKRKYYYDKEKIINKEDKPPQKKVNLKD